jgi:DNA-directed RNA polymerase subunit RPC12/RpoP
MGYGFELKCKECDYSQNFFLGIGMMYSELKNVVNQDNIKSKKLRNNILDIIDNHSVEKCSYSHQLYRCEKCGRLNRKFYVELHYDEGKVFKTEYNCVKCREPLKVVDTDYVEEISCPQCCNKKLYRDMEMLWD